MSFNDLMPGWPRKLIGISLVGSALFLFVGSGVFVMFRPTYEIVYAHYPERTYCEHKRGRTMAFNRLEHYVDRACQVEARCSRCWTYAPTVIANTGAENQPVAISFRNLDPEQVFIEPVVRSQHLLNNLILPGHKRPANMGYHEGQLRLLLPDVPPGDELVVQLLLKAPGPDRAPRLSRKVSAPFGDVIDGDPTTTLVGRAFWETFGGSSLPLAGRRLVLALQTLDTTWTERDFENESPLFE